MFEDIVVVSENLEKADNIFNIPGILDGIGNF